MDISKHIPKINQDQLINDFSNKKYLARETVYKRYVKLMKFMKFDKSSIKNDNGQILFTEIERDFIFVFLDHLDHPYLKGLANGKVPGKDWNESFEYAMQFRDILLKEANKTEDQNILRAWNSVIEELTQKTLKEYENSLITKINSIGEFFIKNLNYEQKIEIIQEVNTNIDKWIDSIKLKYGIE